MEAVEEKTKNDTENEMMEARLKEMLPAPWRRFGVSAGVRNRVKEMGI